MVHSRISLDARAIFLLKRGWCAHTLGRHGEHRPSSFGASSVLRGDVGGDSGRDRRGGRGNRRRSGAANVRDAERGARVRARARRRPARARLSRFPVGVQDTAIVESEENESLYAHIGNNPNDVASLLVLADWLQHRGHPRGQLIALQYALGQDPNDAEISRQIEALVERHRAELFGGLAENPELVDVDLRLGFAERVQLFLRHPATVDLDAQSLATAFLEHPTCRFVRRIVLTLGDDYDYRAQSGELVSALVAARSMPTVRSLQIGNPSKADSKIHVPAALSDVLPNLAELAIFGAGVTFESATFASLHTLVLWDRVEHAKTAFERCRFPKLKRLAVGGGAVDAFLASDLRRRIEVLEVEDELGARALEDWASRRASALAQVPSIVLHGDPNEADVQALWNRDEGTVERVAAYLGAAGVHLTITPDSLAETYAIREWKADDGDGSSDDDDADSVGYPDSTEVVEREPEEEDEEEDEAEHEEPGVD